MFIGPDHSAIVFDPVAERAGLQSGPVPGIESHRGQVAQLGGPMSFGQLVSV
jgi:hypothetical protein